jgi:hypothetical protein
MSVFFGSQDDRMQEEPSSSQGSNVWNEMPDDVLQEMQKHLTFVSRVTSADIFRLFGAWPLATTPSFY